MTEEKRSKFIEALLEAYNAGIFKIVWSSSGFTMALDSKRKELIPEINDEEFVDYAFSIIKTVIDLADGREIAEEKTQDLEIAQLIFEKEYDLKNHLFIKRNSKIDCFKLLEYELIAHRSEEKPINIEANSAILKIVTEKNDMEDSHAFEISRRDLDAMINKLMELKEKMDDL